MRIVSLMLVLQRKLFTNAFTNQFAATGTNQSPQDTELVYSRHRRFKNFSLAALDTWETDRMQTTEIGLLI